MDGASIPKGINIHPVYNANWYVNKFSSCLKFNIDKLGDSCNIKNLVKNTIDCIIEEMNLHKYIYNDKIYFPSSTFILLKIDSYNITYFLIGDSILLYENGFKFDIITDLRLQNIAVEERKKVFIFYKR